jgi:2-oxoglutarate ferredoxin oxidoreductase subunit delta
MSNRQIDIIESWCKGCGICVNFCPTKVLELNPMGKAVAQRLDDCTGCELCARLCPDLAITVLELEHTA